MFGFSNRDYLTIGTTPTGEDCAQLGSPDYYEKTKIEARVFIKMIERLFPEEMNDSGLSIRLKGFTHDFGTYHEICLGYNVSTEEDEDGEIILTSSEQAALTIDNNLPESWDEIALRELEKEGYYKPMMEVVHNTPVKERVLKKA